MFNSIYLLSYKAGKVEYDFHHNWWLPHFVNTLLIVKPLNEIISGLHITIEFANILTEHVR